MILATHWTRQRYFRFYTLIQRLFEENFSHAVKVQNHFSGEVVSQDPSREQETMPGNHKTQNLFSVLRHDPDAANKTNDRSYSRMYLLLTSQIQPEHKVFESGFDSSHSKDSNNV